MEMLKNTYSEPTKKQQKTIAEKLLIVQDCEPDDYLAMIMLNKFLAENINFYVLVVSPNPEKHMKDTAKLFESMKTKRKIELHQGATYSREKGFVEPEKQSFDNLDDFFKTAKDDSIDVLLLTTCYGLMKPFKDEYLAKINMVWNMGGEGVQGVVKGTTIRTYGFNWRVGTEYAKVFMDTIPTEKRVLLESCFYNSDFMEKFKGTVSICPKTFPNFIKVLFASELEIAKLFIEHNTNWVRAMLKTQPSGWKYYEKGLEDHYIGPADILVGFCYLASNGIEPHNQLFHVSSTERSFKDKDGHFNGDKYTIQSIDKIEYSRLEELLIKTFQ